jgi:cytochrome P450
MMGRIAADDMAIGETTVVNGDATMLLLAAAQRDPEHTTEPMSSTSIVSRSLPVAL